MSLIPLSMAMRIPDPKPTVLLPRVPTQSLRGTLPLALSTALFKSAIAVSVGRDVPGLVSSVGIGAAYDEEQDWICDDELESGEDSLFEFDEARLCVEAEREVVPGRGLAMLTNLVNGFGMSD
ncbi:hypothetical protein BKA83DRAFT_4479836 [Pisolithus microcarpus]|nr:hypothetical protein BKA83DRAFT_4479836 [Pisolithus microcarpus]